MWFFFAVDYLLVVKIETKNQLVKEKQLRTASAHNSITKNLVVVYFSLNLFNSHVHFKIACRQTHETIYHKLSYFHTLFTAFRVSSTLINFARTYSEYTKWTTIIRSWLLPIYTNDRFKLMVLINKQNIVQQHDARAVDIMQTRLHPYPCAAAADECSAQWEW